MVATTEIPIAKKAAALIDWTDPWFAVMVLLADLAAAKGLTREQVHFAVDFVLDDDTPIGGKEPDHHQERALPSRCADREESEETPVEPLSVPGGATSRVAGIEREGTTKPAHDTSAHLVAAVEYEAIR